ncbi:MAG: hypothetical protein EOO16_15550 [Chitinophagaceae bacterium]|nr:MAG: hypothetical protein EOO16_15550 [Chitinophagaceae bacterium]
MLSETQLPATSEQASDLANENLQSFYNDAARQLVQEKLVPEAVIDNLIARGASRDKAEQIVYDLDDQIRKAKKSRAQKDMLYGGLWCAGGTIATMASVGYIFWGAIIFGGIQFFRGVANLND